MNWHEREIDILELLAKAIESCARLYEAYSRAFPELEGFWFGLVMEEVDNSNLVHNCVLQIRKGSIHVDTDRIDPVALRSLLDLVQGELTRIRRKKMDIVDAISVAIDIESRIIEGEYLEVLSSYLEEIGHPLPYPVVTAKNHVKVLQQMFQDLSGNV